MTEINSQVELTLARTEGHGVPDDIAHGPLNSAPASIMIAAKNVEHVYVQKKDLRRLRYELHTIHFTKLEFDWENLLVGSAITSTITMFVELATKEINTIFIVYAVVSVILWITSFIYNNRQKNHDDTTKNEVTHEHALRTLEDIFRAANLPFTDSDEDSQ